jgi:anti-sigma factor ChrR (cupin superfamily)
MDVLGLSLDELRARARNPDLGWTAFAPGIEIHRLVGDAESSPSAALLRYAPGAQGPWHRHEGIERVYVLSGAQRDERGVYAEGTQIVNQPGTVHRVSSPEGCVVFVVWERPNTFFGGEPPR